MGVSMTFATLAGSLLIFRTLSIQAQALQVQQKELKIQERNNHRTNIELSYRRMIELIMKKCGRNNEEIKNKYESIMGQTIFPEYNPQNSLKAQDYLKEKVEYAFNNQLSTNPFYDIYNHLCYVIKYIDSDRILSKEEKEDLLNELEMSLGIETITLFICICCRYTNTEIIKAISLYRMFQIKKTNNTKYETIKDIALKNK